MSENKLLSAALKYASQYGWAVFPIRPEDKRPLTPHGCKDAKKDPGAIRAWWKRWPNANVGVATGSASNLVVIDEDYDPDKGIDGIMSMREWAKVHGELPDTAMVITGRGGSHLYFHYTGKDIKNRAGIIEGVDVRGEGGYVVAPPSLHQNGSNYEWEQDPDDVSVADLDGTVKEFLSIGATGVAGNDFHVPTTIPSGERNSTLFKIACSMQAQGYPDAVILASLESMNKTACVEPLDDEELHNIAESALHYKKGEMKVLSQNDLVWHAPKLDMTLDKDGEPTDKVAQTIKNAEEAIEYDKDLFGRLWFSEIAYSPVVYGSLPWRQWKGWREWDNTDDSNMRSYLEDRYGLKNEKKIIDALQNVTTRHKINPIKTMLEEAHERWDGNKHVENLLPMFTGAEKTDYNTAALRLFMLGAVSRIYHPGCKFDYMLVLVGGQGKYKSSFFEFLAVNTSWLSDNFNSLDGDRAFEKLRGMWIVEMAELQATKRAKDVESIKSFITSRDDVYRAPYNRRTEHHPRMCVLGGTSNPTDFLTDRTGNRRFLPILCGIHDVPNPHDDPENTKGEMLQAWGEIMDEYLRAGGRVRLVLPKKFEEQALAAQEDYMEEDPYIGVLQNWLDNTKYDRVCSLMIWKEAFGHIYDDCPLKETRRIHDIMRNNITGWHPVGKQYVDGYGVVRAYECNKFMIPDIPFD